ncbi:MAG TPA: signal recognition particle protein [Treponemataceae bacterium]|jgi:signal recognition particle subunit SRP54|nr:signal recognition particle protein [Treponemataceae bacterium]
MLEKVTNALGDVVRRFAGKSTISEKNIEEAVEEIKMALLEADVNLRVVRRFVNATIEEAKGEKVLRAVDPGQQFVKIVHDRLVALLGDSRQDLKLKGPDTLSVVLFLGLQGSGKTTSAAKLALRLAKQGRKPLLAACDLARPAAVEQLSILGERVGVPVYKEDSKDPVRVAKGALQAARKGNYDVLIVDTAGRMQADEALMDEILAVKKAVDPVETVLVADAMTGQNAVEIAKAFDEKVSLTGVILTKFDSDARGGAALSLKSVTGKPILFVGTGEKVEDLEPFYPERLAGRILGMGDVVSLVEKAQETIDAAEAEKLQKKMAGESFSLQDMLDQLERVNKMGSIQSMLEMIPGLAGQVDAGAIDTSGLKTQKAIIQSMTLKERSNHLIIGPSRRKRIAKGSGTSVAEVNKLIKQFEKTRQTMRKFAKNRGMQAKMMGGMPGF